MRVLRAPVLGLRALPSPLATPLATVTRIAPTSHTSPPHSLARGIHTTPCSAIHRAEAGDKFGPGHHQPHVQKKKGSVTLEERERVLERTRNKIDKVTEWARVVVYDGVERAHGRLTPAVLDGIKLTTPKGSAALKSLTSITTVPADRALRVEAFDAGTAKHVLQAIKDAHIPGLTPSREDNIVRVAVAAPTGEVRDGLLKNIHDGIESAKNQVRGTRGESLKALGGRGEEGSEEVQEICEGAVGMLEGMWVGVREEMKKP